MIASIVWTMAVASPPGKRGLPIGVATAVAGGALVLQASLPGVVPLVSLLNLPLLAALYLMIMSGSALVAMTAGLFIGWIQDGMTHWPVGTHGMVYVSLGYLMARLGQRANLGLLSVVVPAVATAYLLHEVLLYVVRTYIIDQQAAFEPGAWLALAGLHGGLAVCIYPLFDRLVDQE